MAGSKYHSDKPITKPQIAETKTVIEKMNTDDGFMVKETGFNTYAARSANVKIPNLLEVIQGRTLMTRRVIFDVLDAANMFEHIPINPQQVIDEVSWAINRVKQRLAVDGVKYEKTGESYDMLLFENRELETYLYDAATKSGAVEVVDQEKTVHDYVSVDSEVEYNFMKSLEGNEAVKFYVKLPSWFKIDTPVGSYNPDWAVAFGDDKRVYFVAETKGSNDLYDNYISSDERSKILSGRQHFSSINVPYAAPVNSLNTAIEKATHGRTD